MRHLTSLLALVAILGGCATSIVPPEYETGVNEALALAGENKAELLGVIQSVPPEMRSGAAFLVAHLPYPDLASIKADVLREHIEYAYRAKAKYPWMKDMPEEVFFHYVLPYRCSEEPVEAYRKYFFDQLDPIVSGLDDMADVVHQVNLWLGAPKADGKSRVRFVPTEARDQGPLETLKSGYGRCEEMMIVYMAAARSVGIPCRGAWTPYWAVCDNNHAWVEVWVSGRWQPIGGCEPGTPWFEHPAKRAAAVYSATVGQPKSEIIYRSTGTVSLINSTPNYSKTCKVSVTVKRDGKPVPKVAAVISVFNWGSFRPVMGRATDADGKSELLVGIGEYFLSAGDDAGRAWQVVKTEPDKTVEIALDLKPDAAPDGFLFLRYPTLDQAIASFNMPALAPRHPTAVAPSRPAPPELYAVDEFDPAKSPEVMALIKDSKNADAVLQRLKSAGGNWREIAAAVKEVPPESREDLLFIAGQLAHIETLEVTKDFLLEQAVASGQARTAVAWKTPDELYRPFVLSPAFQYLHLSPWRAELYRRFSHLTKPTIEETARAVNDWVKANIQLKKDGLAGRFSIFPSPLDTCRSGLGDSSGVAIFAAALLRTLSVPARVKEEWVEFHDGKDWRPLYPHDPANFGNVKRDETTQKAYTAQPAGLKINLIRKGAIDPTPWEKIAVSRFEKGAWYHLEDLPRTGKWQRLQPGTYLVTAGVRNSNGDAMVYCRQFTFKEGEGIVLDLPVDIPPGALTESERVVRKLDKLPDFELADVEGRIHSLAGLLEKGPTLLTFFSLGNEPSIRMLPMIDQLREKAEKQGVKMAAIFIDSEGKQKLLSDSRLGSIAMPVLLDTDQKVARQFIPDLDKNKSACLPSTLLISGRKAGSRIVVWDEGYNMAIDTLIEAGLGLLADRAPALKPAEPKITRKPFAVGPDHAGAGDRFLKETNYPKAIEAYLEALKVNEDDAGVWYNLACAYSLSGKIDEGLNALRKSIENGWTEMHWMDNDPDLGNVRNDPRYKELRK